jgi:4-hydroxy-tetrahydrodipicolinate reductase
VGFDSRADHITLEHVARSREGFAEGALMGARWIIGRKGLYEFSEVFDEILSEESSEY